jgi:hypothetical protein
MTDFGRYRLTFTPPDLRFGAHTDTTIDHSISAEADLDRMCDFFDSFLRACGYVYDGKVDIVPPETEYDSREYWKEKFFGLVNSDD